MLSIPKSFSEILSGVKLSGAVFFSAEFSAPWGLSAPAGKVVAEQVAPGAAHVVLYYLLIDGMRSLRWTADSPSRSPQEMSSSFRTAIRTT